MIDVYIFHIVDAKTKDTLLSGSLNNSSFDIVKSSVAVLATMFDCKTAVYILKNNYSI